MKTSRAIHPPAPTPDTSALKPIDPAALQASVERVAKKLGVAGAVVLLRTPQGTYRAVTGTVERGRTEPPPTVRTSFPGALEWPTAAAMAWLPRRRPALPRVGGGRHRAGRPSGSGG